LTSEIFAEATGVVVPVRWRIHFSKWHRFNIRQ